MASCQLRVDRGGGVLGSTPSARNGGLTVRADDAIETGGTTHIGRLGKTAVASP